MEEDDTGDHHLLRGDIEQCGKVEVTEILRGALLVLHLMSMNEIVIQKHHIMNGHSCEVRKTPSKQEMPHASSNLRGKSGLKNFAGSCECGLVAMTVLVMKDTLVLKMALTAAMVVDMAAVETAKMEVIMTEVILEVPEAIMLLAITIIKFAKGGNFGGHRSCVSYCSGGQVFAKSQSQSGPAVSAAVEGGSSYCLETAKQGRRADK